MTRRAILFTSVFLTFAGWSTSAGADAAECIAAHGQGQLSRDDGHTLEARQSFAKCARESCPQPIQGECDQWLVDIEKRIPSVVFDVRDREGNDIVDVRIYVDDAPLDRVSGRPVELDPGPKTFRFEATGFQDKTQKALLRETEKDRRIAVVLEPVKAAAPTAKRSKPEPETDNRGIPAVSWVLGGIGVAGLASFTYFSLAGRSKRQELETDCKPDCTQDDIAPVKRSYLIGDVSLAVGLVAIGGAVWFALDSGKDNASGKRRPLVRGSVALSRSGGSAVIDLGF